MAEGLARQKPVKAGSGPLALPAPVESVETLRGAFEAARIALGSHHAFGQFSPCGRAQIRRDRGRGHRRSVGTLGGALVEPARGPRGQGAGRTRDGGQRRARRSQAGRGRTAAGDSRSGQDPVRRPQLRKPRRRGRPSDADGAQRLLALQQHARRPWRRHRAPARLDRFRLRGRARRRDRRALPARVAGQRALGGRRLHLLPRLRASATSRSIRRPPARTSRRPGRSGRGWSPRTSSPIRSGWSSRRG